MLGFPFIFRGALDVRARAINHEMEIAATRALAALAREDVPDAVLRAYGLRRLRFGPEYIIPKPFDPRVLIWESAAVAEAAMQTGVARVRSNLKNTRSSFRARLGRTYEVMQSVRQRAKAEPKRIVFSEGEREKIIRAAYQINEEKIGRPILTGPPPCHSGPAGRPGHPATLIPKLLSRSSRRVSTPMSKSIYRLRQRHGVTLSEAHDQMI